jgi:hypothetical protein
MTQGVHGSVHGVQPSPPHPPIDRVWTQAERNELSALHHPVLPTRKLRNRPVEGVRRHLTAHYAVKCRRTPFRPGGVGCRRA